MHVLLLHESVLWYSVVLDVASRTSDSCGSCSPCGLLFFTHNTHPLSNIVPTVISTTDHHPASALLKAESGLGATSGASEAACSGWTDFADPPVEPEPELSGSEADLAVSAPSSVASPSSMSFLPLLGFAVTSASSEESEGVGSATSSMAFTSLPL